MVRRIVRRFKPERIILFGSQTRGGADRNSDVDLLVIMPVSGEKREKQIEVGVALSDLAVPVDIIVTTPEEFDWRKEIPGTVERPAWLEGQTVYAKE